MKVRILSWNVRGVNDQEKRKVIKAFIKTQKVDIVCLQETKLKGISSETVRSLGVEDLLSGLVLMQLEP